MTTWKKPAVPRHVVQMFVMDRRERVLIMHRSNNVRSARNVWSIPTGEHEIGETIEQTIERELHEEYGFREVLETRQMFTYENIAGDEDQQREQYHWVISVYLVLVDDVTKAVNREPEKHDKLEFAPLFHVMRSSQWKQLHTFHKSLDEILQPKARQFFNLVWSDAVMR